MDFLAGLATGGDDFRAQERALDAAAWSLRRTWLGLAHRPADDTPKSPCAGQSSHVASGGNVDFGYERDLDVSLLERRRDSYMERPDGWSAELVLFRSGQAALAALLQLSISRWGKTGPLTYSHAGAYFETKALLESWPQRILRGVERSEGTADLVIAEPAWCDGQFGCLGEMPSPRDALVLDTTMMGASYSLARHLNDDCPLVIAYSSGLKLDQAGLELANVGIVRILAREGHEEAARVAADLRQIRGLVSTGLTLDELSALSAPWFMNRAYADTYTGGIFANNRALARAIGTRSAIFTDRCHPSLFGSRMDAPFCAIELRDPSPARYAALLRTVEREIERRGLLATRGGSFGFRGHRYELIEPEPDKGRTFLRVALGWRGGWSCEGLCALFADLAREGFD